MIEVKSQLQPVRAESEALVTLSANTKIKDGNSVYAKKASHPQITQSCAAPMDHLAMLVKQVVFATIYAR